MPLYEYYCAKCGTRYELLRPMNRSDEPGTCPRGHDGGTRAISMFAAVSKGNGADVASAPLGGGCGCGAGSCGCGH